LSSDDAINLRREPFEGVFHFIEIRMTVVDTANPGDHVAQTPLGDIGQDARTAQE
jgi:hypothetical protein